MKPLPTEIRNNILCHIDNGMSDRKIAQVVNVSRSSVQNIRKKHCLDAPTASHRHNGHPPKLSAQDK